MNDKPLVSILINNYNYENFLAEAIDSALSQTYSSVEVVVVDDGSKDNSREVINNYGARIVSVFKKNGGQASAFNAGFQASQGEIICFLDADDYYAANKVSRIVELFRQNPGSGWIFHELDDVDTNKHHLEFPINLGVSECVFSDLRENILKGHLLPQFPATSGLCFKRNILKQILPMPEQLLISADNFLRLATIYLSPGLLLPDKLAVHRIHGANLFEFRSDTAFLNAETNIKTSYYLRKQFPETKLFADRLYANAFGMLAGKTSFNRVFEIPESWEYIKNFSFGAFLKCSARMTYNYAKAVIS